MNEKCIEKLWIMMNLTHEFPISFFCCCNAGDEFIIITYLDDMKVTVVTNVCSWTVFHEILIDLAAEICGKIFERVHALQKWQNWRNHTSTSQILLPFHSHKSHFHNHCQVICFKYFMTHFLHKIPLKHNFKLTEIKISFFLFLFLYALWLWQSHSSL